MRFKFTKQDRKTVLSNVFLCSVGMILMMVGLANVSEAATPTVYDTWQIDVAICQILGLMEGSLGAFLTAVAGAGAVVASAFGAYRAGFSLIVVATSSFIMHSLVSLWFADYQCQPASKSNVAKHNFNEKTKISKKPVLVPANGT